MITVLFCLLIGAGVISLLIAIALVVVITREGVAELPDS